MSGDNTVVLLSICGALVTLLIALVCWVFLRLDGAVEHLSTRIDLMISELSSMRLHAAETFLTKPEFRDHVITSATEDGKIEHRFRNLEQQTTLHGARLNAVESKP